MLCKGKTAKVLDYELIIYEFKIHLFYYVHFRTNTYGKAVNPVIPFLWVK